MKKDGNMQGGKRFIPSDHLEEDLVYSHSVKCLSHLFIYYNSRFGGCTLHCSVEESYSENKVTYSKLYSLS